MMLTNFFCSMIDQGKALALFPAETIARDPQHRKYPTRQSKVLNLRRA